MLHCALRARLTLSHVVSVRSSSNSTSPADSSSLGCALGLAPAAGAATTAEELGLNTASMRATSRSNARAAAEGGEAAAAAACAGECCRCCACPVGVCAARCGCAGGAARGTAAAVVAMVEWGVYPAERGAQCSGPGQMGAQRQPSRASSGLWDAHRVGPQHQSLSCPQVRAAYRGARCARFPTAAAVRGHLPWVSAASASPRGVRSLPCVWGGAHGGRIRGRTTQHTVERCSEAQREGAWGRQHSEWTDFCARSR